MQPRVRRKDAGWSRAFLRRPGRTPEARSGPGAACGVRSAPAESGPDRSSAAPEEKPAGSPSPADLRQAIAVLEGRLEAGARLAPARTDAALRLRFAVPALDALFPAGGLALAAVTELRCAETREAGALSGFLAALAVRLSDLRQGPVLAVREAEVARETGRVSPLGLVHLGFDPARLIVVEARDAAEALWAVEEGLGCPGLATVLAEIKGLPRALSLTASRRLALRARESGVPALLALLGAPAAASAAAVRIRVAPRLSGILDGFAEGGGLPAWSLTVEKNRDGRTGRADLEWSHDDRLFRTPAEPLPAPLAAAARHGPDRPPRLGQVVAFGPERAAG